MIRRLFWALALAALAQSSLAAECRQTTHLGTSYSVCEIAPAREELRLFLNDENGVPYGHFSRVRDAIAPKGEHLSFAMNAGMYHPDRSPVGYFRENDQERMRLITSAGPGNFGLLPNGVFCIQEKAAHVIETLAFAAQNTACRFASQSGPLLIKDGQLHPRFLENSTSKFIRNGVGTSARGDRAVFVISDAPVNFHQFASFFRDDLRLPNALYFDGNISRLFAPGIGRDDMGFAMGPIVGAIGRDN